jgi:putative membrane protein
MYWLIQLLINAGILLLLANIIPGVKIRSYGTAIGVSLVIGILNATVGFLIRLPLNIITFGLLSFFVRLLVTAIVIKITDKFFSGFEVRSFTTAVILACAMALASTLVNFIL